MKYEWRLINAADQRASLKIVLNELQADITIDVPGIYNLELFVTDSHGASRAAAVPAVVGNERPLIRFTKPVAGDFFDAQQSIRYELFVKDAEDGTNDDYEMDVNNVAAIDPDSPGRVSVNAVFASGPLRVASAGAGGQIEVRLDQPDGILLATSDIEVNGQWEQWYARHVDLPKTSGRHDVIIRFVHPQQAGGLMNLDSIHFQR